MSDNNAAVAAPSTTDPAPAPAAAASSSSPASTATTAAAVSDSSSHPAASTTPDATSSQQQQQSSEHAASSSVAPAPAAAAVGATAKPAKAPRTQQRGKAKASASASPPAAASPDAATATATVAAADQAAPEAASSPSPSSSPTSAQPQKSTRQPRQSKKAAKQQQQQQQQQQDAASSPEAGPAAVVAEQTQPAVEQTTARGRKQNNKQQAAQAQTQAQQAPTQSPTAPTEASSSPPVQAPKREGRGKQKERQQQTPAGAVAATTAASGPSQADVIAQMLASQQEVLRQLTALKLQAQQPEASAATTAAAAPSPVVATAAAAVTEAPAAVSSPAAPTRKPMQRHPTSAGGAAAPASANTSMRVSTPAARPAPATGTASAAPAANPSRSMPAAAAAASVSGRNIIVLKVGSASLSTDDCKLLHLSNICNLVETICTLKQSGFQVILVTSGAVAVGCQRLGLTQRPTSLVTKQAVAAIGQSRLMRVYDDLFSAMSQPIAQVLLTRENLSAHHHYVNALNTFRELLRMGIVPVVNENDVVSVSELKVGDNDTLSALVASLVQARWLFLLTDVAGLYDSDPRSNPAAKIVHTVQEIGDLRVSLGSSGSIGTGGMTTKLVAAGIATAAGVHTGIIKSTELGNIERMMRGELVGTHFLPVANPLKSHKKWIAHGLKPEGAIVLDAGASDAIVVRHTSLFSAGVVGVQGKFAAGASVRLLRAEGKDAAAAPTTPNKQQGGKKNASVAAPSSPSPSPLSAQESSAAPLPPPRGRVYSAAECASLVELGVCVVNFEADEVLRLSGQHSREFARILGYDAPAELASRENLVITYKGAPSASPPAPAAAAASSPQR